MAFLKYAKSNIVRPAVTFAGWDQVCRKAAQTSFTERKGSKVVLEKYDPKQYLLSHCFPPGHRVLMGDGTEKVIEHVVPGDLVLTHKGNIRPVTKVITREVHELLVVIQSASLPDVACTSEHPFFVIRQQNAWCRVFPSYRGQVKCTYGGKQVCTKHSCSTNGAVPEWVEASDLKVGDRTYTPTLHDTQVDFDLNANRLRVLGYYVAEGRVDVDYRRCPYSIRFSIHDDEVKTIGAEIASLMKQEFGVCSHSVIKDRHRNSRGVTLSFHSHTAALWFLKHAGCGSRTKRLSMSVVTAPVSWQKQFIGAWMTGDGCYDRQGIRLATSSDHLASQAVVILDRLDIHSHLGRVLPLQSPRKSGPFDYIKPFDGWHVSVSRSYVEKLSEVTRWLLKGNNSRGLCTKGRYRYAASTISVIEGVTKKQYDGVVYNLAVDGDESYVVNRQAVHNCTIMASVDTEDGPGPLGTMVVDNFQVNRKYQDYYITPATVKFTNNNHDSWSRPVLLSAFRTFVGANNYVEHIQIPELSKGRIVDAAARDIGESVYVDILVATDRKHAPLIQAIESGQLKTLSMGCSVTATQCTKCGNYAQDETQLCPHIKYFKGSDFYDSFGAKRKVAELCGHVAEEPGSVKFIEASWVANPAFTGAVLRNILSAADVERLGGRIQVAFSQPARLGDRSMQRAANAVPAHVRRVLSQDPTTQPQEPPKEQEPKKDEDPVGKAVDDLASDVREKALKKVREEINKDEVSRLNLDENENESIIRSALRTPQWAAIARKVLSSTGDPSVAKRLLWGLILHKKGGWAELVKTGGFTGRDLLAVARTIDLLTRRTLMAGESAVYRTVVAVRGTAKYPDTTAYLRACGDVLGREVTSDEKVALIDKGRLFDLGS